MQEIANLCPFGGLWVRFPPSPPNALVVQWIRRKVADLVMQVRILPRAHKIFGGAESAYKFLYDIGVVRTAQRGSGKLGISPCRKLFKTEGCEGVSLGSPLATKRPPSL